MGLIFFIMFVIIFICSILIAGRTAEIKKDLEKIKKALNIEDEKKEYLEEQIKENEQRAKELAQRPFDKEDLS